MWSGASRAVQVIYEVVGPVGPPVRPPSGSLFIVDERRLPNWRDDGFEYDVAGPADPPHAVTIRLPEARVEPSEDPVDTAVVMEWRRVVAPSTLQRRAFRLLLPAEEAGAPAAQPRSPGAAAGAGHIWLVQFLDDEADPAVLSMGVSADGRAVAAWTQPAEQFYPDESEEGGSDNGADLDASILHGRFPLDEEAEDEEEEGGRLTTDDYESDDGDEVSESPGASQSRERPSGDDDHSTDPATREGSDRSDGDDVPDDRWVPSSEAPEDESPAHSNDDEAEDVGDSAAADGRQPGHERHGRHRRRKKHKKHRSKRHGRHRRHASDSSTSTSGEPGRPESWQQQVAFQQAMWQAWAAQFGQVVANGGPPGAASTATGAAATASALGDDSSAADRYAEHRRKLESAEASERRRELHAYKASAVSTEKRLEAKRASGAGERPLPSTSTQRPGARSPSPAPPQQQGVAPALMPWGMPWGIMGGMMPPTSALAGWPPQLPAQPPAPPPPPPGAGATSRGAWLSAVDPKTNKTYFYHSETGEARWTFPAPDAARYTAVPPPPPPAGSDSGTRHPPPASDSRRPSGDGSVGGSRVAVQPATPSYSEFMRDRMVEAVSDVGDESSAADHYKAEAIRKERSREAARAARAAEEANTAKREAALRGSGRDARRSSAVVVQRWWRQAGNAKGYRSSAAPGVVGWAIRGWADRMKYLRNRQAAVAASRTGGGNDNGVEGKPGTTRPPLPSHGDATDTTTAVESEAHAGERKRAHRRRHHRKRHHHRHKGSTSSDRDGSGDRDGSRDSDGHRRHRHHHKRSRSHRHHRHHRGHSRRSRSRGHSRSRSRSRSRGDGGRGSSQPPATVNVQVVPGGVTVGTSGASAWDPRMSGASWASSSGADAAAAAAWHEQQRLQANEAQTQQAAQSATSTSPYARDVTSRTYEGSVVPHDAALGNSLSGSAVGGELDRAALSPSNAASSEMITSPAGEPVTASPAAPAASTFPWEDMPAVASRTGMAAAAMPVSELGDDGGAGESARGSDRAEPDDTPESPRSTGAADAAAPVAQTMTRPEADFAHFSSISGVLLGSVRAYQTRWLLRSKRVKTLATQLNDTRSLLKSMEGADGEDAAFAKALKTQQKAESENLSKIFSSDNVGVEYARTARAARVAKEAKSKSKGGSGRATDSGKRERLRRGQGKGGGGRAAAAPAVAKSTPDRARPGGVEVVIGGAGGDGHQALPGARPGGAKPRAADMSDDQLDAWIEAQSSALNRELPPSKMWRVMVEVVAARHLVPASMATGESHTGATADRDPFAEVYLARPKAATAQGGAASSAAEVDSGAATDREGEARPVGRRRRTQVVNRSLAPRWKQSFALNIPNKATLAAVRERKLQRLRAERRAGADDDKDDDASDAALQAQVADAEVAEDELDEGAGLTWPGFLVVVEVVDNDRFNKTSFLGHVRLPLARLAVSDTIEEWQALQKRSKHDRVNGELYVRAKLVPPEPAMAVAAMRRLVALEREAADAFDTGEPAAEGTPAAPTGSPSADHHEMDVGDVLPGTHGDRRFSYLKRGTRATPARKVAKKKGRADWSSVKPRTDSHLVRPPGREARARTNGRASGKRGPKVYKRPDYSHVRSRVDNSAPETLTPRGAHGSPREFFGMDRARPKQDFVTIGRPPPPRSPSRSPLESNEEEEYAAHLAAQAHAAGYTAGAPMSTPGSSETAFYRAPQDRLPRARRNRRSGARHDDGSDDGGDGGEKKRRWQQGLRGGDRARRRKGRPGSRNTRPEVDATGAIEYVPESNWRSEMGRWLGVDDVRGQDWAGSPHGGGGDWGELEAEAPSRRPRDGPRRRAKATTGRGGHGGHGDVESDLYGVPFSEGRPRVGTADSATAREWQLEAEAFHRDMRRRFPDRSGHDGVHDGPDGARAPDDSRAQAQAQGDGGSSGGVHAQTTSRRRSREPQSLPPHMSGDAPSAQDAAASPGVSEWARQNFSSDDVAGNAPTSPRTPHGPGRASGDKSPQTVHIEELERAFHALVARGGALEKALGVESPVPSPPPPIESREDAEDAEFQERLRKLRAEYDEA